MTTIAKMMITPLPTSQALATTPSIMSSTDMMDGTIERATEHYSLPDGAFREQLENYIPMGRQGRVEELAAAVSFMCSSGASYITGQTLNVDGGMRLD